MGPSNRKVRAKKDHSNATVPRFFLGALRVSQVGDETRLTASIDPDTARVQRTRDIAKKILHRA